VFRSVGYRGLPLPGIPFDEARGTIPHTRGRVLDAPGGTPIPGLYVAGWIKRGPSGVIGTNKPDAAESADAILTDFHAGILVAPPNPDPAAIEARIRARQPDVFTYDDWLRLDALEVGRGGGARPRVKFTSLEEFLAALRSKR
jgi:ferredoxin--NADP+ reductase